MADALSYLDELGTLPRMVVEGRRLLGLLEAPGPANNPRILALAREVALEKIYTADSIPWCGLYMAVVAKRAGKPVVAGPLWARNWAKFGTPAGPACLGDVLVFSRGKGGHVGIYVGEDQTTFRVLGGNQMDSVSVVRIAKSRCIGIRRPPFKTAMPPSCRPILLAASGKISENEA